MTARRSDNQTLLANVAEIRDRWQAWNGRVDHNLVLERALATSVALRVPYQQIVVLTEARDLREEGLSNARRGQLDLAAERVTEARHTYEDAGLCDEAIVVADSFQHAAESYVHYRGGQFESAERSLRDAMVSCKELGDSYGYAVAARRIHLGRNIVRLRLRQGEQAAAIDLAGRLLQHLAGADTFPWPELVAQSEVLTDDDCLFLADQILFDLSAMIDGKSAALEAALADTNDGWFERPERRTVVDRAFTWLVARRSAAVGDVSGFCGAAEEFFSAGPGLLSEAWRSLSGDLDELTSACATDKAPACP